jgi:hypothetical protein
MVASYLVGLSDPAVNAPALEAANRARWDAYGVLGHVAPFGIAAFALGLRLGTPRGQRADVPVFWLAFGCLVAFGGAELADVARIASFAGGGALGLGAPGMRVLVWVVVLATPAIVLASGVAWLRRRAPPPRDFLHGRGAAFATLASCAFLIGSPLVATPLAVRAYTTLGGGLLLESARAGVQASLVVMSLLVVAAGALALRFRGAVRSAP